MYPYVMEKTPRTPPARSLGHAVSTHISGRRAAVEKLITSDITERRALTQQALLATGRTLIANKGVAGVSVGDLAKEAGFTRGAFYSNFTDMDHFVAEVARLEWQHTLDTIESILSTLEITKDNAIDGAVDVMLQVLPRDRDRYLLWNEFSTVEIRFPDSSAELSAHSQAFSAALVDLLNSILESFDLEPVVPAVDLVEELLGSCPAQRATNCSPTAHLIGTSLMPQHFSNGSCPPCCVPSHAPPHMPEGHLLNSRWPSGTHQWGRTLASETC